MKIEVTTKERQFEPIELKLTIESKEELNTWLSIINAFNSEAFQSIVKSRKSIYADGELAFPDSSNVYEVLKKGCGLES